MCAPTSLHSLKCSCCFLLPCVLVLFVVPTALGTIGGGIGTRVATLAFAPSLLQHALPAAPSTASAAPSALAAQRAQLGNRRLRVAASRVSAAAQASTATPRARTRAAQTVQRDSMVTAVRPAACATSAGTATLVLVRAATARTESTATPRARRAVAQTAQVSAGSSASLMIIMVVKGQPPSRRASAPGCR